MDDSPALQELVAETVEGFCQQDGGGIPLGYLFVVHRIDAAGKQRIHIGCMDGQSPLVSGGLNAYLSKVVDMDIEDDLLGECVCDDEECD